MSGEINFNALIYTCTSMCLSYFFQTMWLEFRTQINTHLNLVNIFWLIFFTFEFIETSQTATSMTAP